MSDGSSVQETKPKKKKVAEPSLPKQKSKSVLKSKENIEPMATKSATKKIDDHFKKKPAKKVVSSDEDDILCDDSGSDYEKQSQSQRRSSWTSRTLSTCLRKYQLVQRRRGLKSFPATMMSLSLIKKANVIFYKQ